MPYSPRLTMALCGLVIILFTQTTLSGQAVAAGTSCKHISPDKMTLCQQKFKTTGKTLQKKPKPTAKPGIDAKDLLWLLL
jgi:hypothetical protein